MALLWYMLGGFGLSVLGYLLAIFYIRRRNGIRPGYAGLLIMCISMGGFLLLFLVLRRFGLDLLHGGPRDIFWLILGFLWLGLAIWTVHQRRSSGTILMDLGPSPLFKLYLACGVSMAAVAIQSALNPTSRAQAFGYVTWSAWFFVMARGRFEIRDGGVISGGLLPWHRISRCFATANNVVSLKLNRGMQRTVDFKLPPDRRDEFIQIVESRKCANGDAADLNATGPAPPGTKRSTRSQTQPPVS
jgi:hypothetical protein